MLVDTVRSGAAPGTIHRVEVTDRPIPASLRSSSSTHAVGVGQAIELARALGRLPSRLDVYAVEGADFALGAGLSAPVAQTVRSLAVTIARAAR